MSNEIEVEFLESIKNYKESGELFSQNLTMDNLWKYIDWGNEFNYISGISYTKSFNGRAFYSSFSPDLTYMGEKYLASLKEPKIVKNNQLEVKIMNFDTMAKEMGINPVIVKNFEDKQSEVIQLLKEIIFVNEDSLTVAKEMLEAERTKKTGKDYEAFNTALNVINMVASFSGMIK